MADASQLTLVDPSAFADPPHAKLYFTPDNMRNALVRRAGGGAPVYTIRSAADFGWTEVRDGAGARVVRLAYHTLRPDTVQWGERAEGKIKDWLPNRSEYPVTLAASNGQKFQIKGDQSRRLAMYDAAAPSTPLAWYTRETAEHSAYLALTPAVDADAVRDEVLAAFLVLRAGLAAGYATYKKAGGMARDMSRPFSNQVYT